MIVMLAVISYYTKLKQTESTGDKTAVDHSHKDCATLNYLPDYTGEFLCHENYALSYREDHEQAEWVAYILTKEDIRKTNVSRYNEFMTDPKVSTRSAVHSDYTNSGYTRGHLAPAGDMAFDEVAMKESFYMSNMSPQLRQFNNGVWRELEETVRDWAFKSGEMYVVSGPILTHPIRTIGRHNKVTVPSAFYKVLLVNNGKKRRGVGFIIPHAISEDRLEKYMVSIDQVEEATTINFFHKLLNESDESKLESQVDTSFWKSDDKRFQLRVTKWNYE